MPDPDSYEPTEPAELNAAEPAPEDFSWPTPPFAAYPAPQAQEQPEPVEITAINGARSVGQLLRLLPGQRQALLRLPSSPQALQVDWDELLSLRLLRPLRVPAALPVQSGGADAADSDFDRRPRHEYRLRLRHGPLLQGQTIGYVEDELGLFLFLPLSAEDDSVHRLFVPREAIEHWEQGRRSGAAFLAADAAPAEPSDLPDQPRRRAQESGVPGLIVSPEQLLQALAAQSRMPIVRIGEALVAMQLISAEQLGAALELQKHERGMPLGQLLVLRGWVRPEELQSALARKMGYPSVDVAHFPIELLALQRLPHAVARRLEALPLLLREGRLIVAMEDPTRRDVLEEIEFVAQAKVVPTLAPLGQLGAGIRAAYERIGAMQEASRRAGEHLDTPRTDQLVESLEREGGLRAEHDERPIEQSDNNLVRLINSMILEAHARGVSDIHIECQPGREKVRIRFRRDGVLATGRSAKGKLMVRLAEHFRGSGMVLRFIEFMDVGCSNGWRMDQVVPSRELQQLVHARWPLRALEACQPGETAERWAYEDGAGEIGFISSVTQAFCGDCNRARLSTDGRVFHCLFAHQGHDLRHLLRDGTSDDAVLQGVIAAHWQRRADRYSQLRGEGMSGLPRVEMHFIGG